MYFELRSYVKLSIAVFITMACSLSPLGSPRAEAQSSGRTFYVAPNGSDSNNGSSATPWLTPQHSSDVAQPGDTVIFEDGTYDLGSGDGRGDWRILSEGTSGNPVTYMAQHKWKAKLIGHGTGDGTSAIGMSGGYTVLQGFDITGSNANGVNITTDGTSASYNQIVGNYIHDMVTPCDGNSGAGITSGSGGNNYAGVGHESVIGNLIVNLVAEGGCPGGHQASGIAMMLPYGIVANNIVINCGDAIEAWHAATNTIFFGNDVLNSGRGLSMGAGDAPGGVSNDNSLVQNNIIVNGSGPAIIETGGTGSHNVYKDNLAFGGNTSIQLSNGLKATGTINADPKFINNTGTAAGDYRLQSTSPAGGTGLALSGISTDFLGLARPQSGATDIGACLLGGSNPSPGSTDVTALVSASPTSITGGQSSIISWATKNAVSATLNGAPVALNGSVTVSPTVTTSYKIAATGTNGSLASGSTTVTVQAAGGTIAAGVVASPTSITAGQTSVITWTTKNAVKATLNGAPVALNGSLTVSPSATTTYKVVATGATGTSDWGSATVAVVQSGGAVTARDGASPASITAGQSSVISWATTNAVSATLNGAPVALNGSLNVSPRATTAYKIVATGSNGSTASGSTTVTVQTAGGVVAAGASASPTSITKGQSSVISWTTKNAVSATLNGTAVGLNGSITVHPSATTTYKVVATGSNGTTDWGSATVTVH